MKQFFLALCLTAGTVAAANAQAPAPNAANGQRLEEYCQVTARAKLNGRYVIAIDYGQRQKLISANLFRDASGKSVEFNSAMDALNWLSAQGWELASTFVLVEDNSSVAYYVLRRRPA